MKNKKLVVGNWKMNPDKLEEAKSLAQAVRRVAKNLLRTEAVICPPFVFVHACLSRTKSPNYEVGVQDIGSEPSGAHTGEISAGMVASIGIRYSIIGHSEKRKAGDTDERISKKLSLALKAGLTPIVCIGENSRDNEGGAHFDFIKEQMKNIFSEIPKKQALDIVLAYEPVWAIGAEEPMAPEQIHEMSLFVRKTFADIFGNDPAMKINVLYGGAVDATNCVQIIQAGQVDGLLVGRQSWSLDTFGPLLEKVDES